jgi:hypothetical protein
MFKKLFKQSEKGCCDVQIVEVKDETCCEEKDDCCSSETEECCKEEEKQGCC